jgi:hypothetical protein
MYLQERKRVFGCPKGQLYGMRSAVSRQLSSQRAVGKRSVRGNRTAAEPSIEIASSLTAGIDAIA